MGLAISEWRSLFDGEPAAMPDATFPPEFPRFSIPSLDRHWEVRVSKTRLDIFWRQGEEGDEIESDQFTGSILSSVRSFLNLSPELVIRRVAYVVHRVSRDENPAQTLSRYFCRDDLLEGPLDRPAKFELHAMKVYQPPDLPLVNSWIRWQVGTNTDTDEEAVLVKQDLNTLSEDMEANRFSIGDLEGFFGRITHEADEILRLYLGAHPPA